MKRAIEIISMLIFIIVNLLFLFGKHFGILLSDSVQGSLHLVIILCLGVNIYLNQNIGKKAKGILMTMLAVSFVVALIIIIS